MPTPNPMTVEHLVGVLRRSRKPSIVVEGDDDVIIYRELTKRIGILEVILRPSGGREKLLQVYERRNEFTQVPVAFIADQDMWLFSELNRVTKMLFGLTDTVLKTTCIPMQA